MYSRTLMPILTVTFLLIGCSRQSSPDPAKPGEKTSGQNTPKEPALPPTASGTPLELFSKVAAAAKVPESDAGKVIVTKDNISEWQKGSKGKAEEQPIELMLTAPFITTTLTRQTLGKPNREETGVVPFLLNQRGEKVAGPIYWYGSVGLCYAKMDFNKVEDEYLVMMKYQPK